MNISVNALWAAETRREFLVNAITRLTRARVRHARAKDRKAKAKAWRMVLDASAELAERIQNMR